MKNAAVLFDVTKCVGCGSCTVACKMWNDRSFEDEACGFDVALTDQNWTVLGYHDAEDKAGNSVLRFLKRQCMHCLNPSCVSVCFAKAIKVTETGAVVYDAKKCVGCRYCMIGCPYDVPKYEWDKVFPSIMKCQLCAGKLEQGESPACSSVCPTGALTFGDRDELIRKAKSTIASDSRYVDHVYGETEGGGTRWLYISDVPFGELGLPTDIPERDIPSMVHDYSKWKPGVFAGAAAVLGGLGFYTWRRLKVEEYRKAHAEEYRQICEEEEGESDV